MSTSTRRIVTRILDNVNFETHVGREGEIFYDTANPNPELKFSDGVTPGGVSVGVGTNVDINTVGIVTATSFVGDGSQLTNVAKPTDAIAYAIALG